MLSHDELMEFLSHALPAGWLALHRDAKDGHEYCPVCGAVRDDYQFVQHAKDCAYATLVQEVEAWKAHGPQKYRVVVFFKTPSNSIFARNLTKQEAVDIRLALCRREDLLEVNIEKD